nr:MAG TPA_asm: hypothetical protein [Caudoviricetes sp.]
MHSMEMALSVVVRTESVMGIRHRTFQKGAD